MLISKIICSLGKLLFIFKKRGTPPSPEKILVIRSGAIGDVLMSTPLLTAIRRKYPKAEVCYMVGKWSSQALKNNPNINKIIEFEDETIYKKNLIEVLKLIEKIRKEGFDLCFVLDKSWLWGLFAWMCSIKFRIGFDRKGEGFAYNISVPFEGIKYELEHNLDLARKIGMKVVDKKMRIYYDKKDLTNAENFLRNNKIKNRALIGIAPGGAVNPGQNFLEKKWPEKKYIELIKKILKMRKNYCIVLFGGLSDKSLLEYLKNKINSKKIIIAPLSCIQITYLLMNKCKVIITHDSGAMHIAGATNSKIIALFGPTPSKRFAPRNSIVLEVKSKECPCYNIYGNYDKICKEDCMKNIGIDRVFAKLNYTLKR